MSDRRVVRKFRDFESAQRASMRKTAVSANPIRIVKPSGSGMEKNPTVLIDLVMEAGRQPYAVYHSAFIRIPESQYKPSAKEIDRVRWWKAV